MPCLITAAAVVIAAGEEMRSAGMVGIAFV
jgi:hypothetical protein